MHLATLWYLLIAFLWTGYLVLDGFDFGVGILLPHLGRDERGRRVLLATIGPVWDGNEVWVIVAAGAMFAAFPDWYATVFSGFYLPTLAILVALICRGVALEYRGKRDDARWRARCDAAIVAGSAVPAALWGVLFGDIVHGLPLDTTGDYTGGTLALFTPYALLAGATTLTLSVAHGAVFLALKTRGDIRAAARRTALRAGGLAAATTTVYLTWTQLRHPTTTGVVLAAAAAALLAAALAATRRGRDGLAFAGTAAAIATTIACLFTALYPNLLPATDPANSLTIGNAAAPAYTLRVISWAALAFTPLVIGYQAWSYWVFRRRLGRADLPAAP